jgi:hypothetical protein
MRIWALMLGAVFLLAACEEDRPVVTYKPGVYQGAADQKIGDKERRDMAERAKHMGRM